MKIVAKKRKVVSSVYVVIIDGIEVDAYDFLGCLEALEETDGAFTVITISNSNVEKILLKHKLAYKNVRGSWAKQLNTKAIEKFKAEVYRSLDKLSRKEAVRL